MPKMIDLRFYCTPSWREPPNHGPKDCSVSTRRNDSATFKRCMHIPPKSKAQFWIAVGSPGAMSHFTGYRTNRAPGIQKLFNREENYWKFSTNMRSLVISSTREYTSHLPSGETESPPPHSAGGLSGV